MNLQSTSTYYTIPNICIIYLSFSVRYTGFKTISLKECDSVSIAGLSTAGFVFRSFPRQSGRSGGGTGMEWNGVSEWNVCVHKQTIKVVTIYRPPYSEDHPVSSNVFFDEFSSYLENIVMINPEVLLITGDFNFHVDCPTEAQTRKSLRT